MMKVDGFWLLILATVLIVSPPFEERSEVSSQKGLKCKGKKIGKSGESADPVDKDPSRKRPFILADELGLF